MKYLMNRNSIRELLVFSLLLAFGVLGRWAQPEWNFTPLTAVTAMGAYYFRHWLPALLLPASVLAISDLLLAPHDNWQVLVAVHAMAVVPLLLGRAARGTDGWRRAAYWGMCGFVPATAFYLVTNFAVWLGRSDYAPTLAGLGECYVRGLPFFRWMLAGDLFYVGLMAACVALAEVWERRRAPAPATLR